MRWQLRLVLESEVPYLDPYPYPSSADAVAAVPPMLDRLSLLISVCHVSTAVGCTCRTRAEQRSRARPRAVPQVPSTNVSTQASASADPRIGGGSASVRHCRANDVDVGDELCLGSGSDCLWFCIHRRSRSADVDLNEPAAALAVADADWHTDDAPNPNVDFRWKPSLHAQHCVELGELDVRSHRLAVGEELVHRCLLRGCKYEPGMRIDISDANGVTWPFRLQVVPRGRGHRIAPPTVPSTSGAFSTAQLARALALDSRNGSGWVVCSMR